MKGQDSVFSLIKNTKLPSELLIQYDNGAEKLEDPYTLGGILSNTKYAWLASGSKLVVIDLSVGQRFASWHFGATLSNCQTKITCVTELPTPLLDGTIQLAVGLECEFTGGMICIFHCNGSRVLRCIQTESIVTWLAIVDNIPDGFLTCFNSIILAGNQNGEILAIDLNRNECIEAVNYPIRGDYTIIKDELNMARVSLLSLEDINLIEQQKIFSTNAGDHIAVQLNEMSIVGNKFLFHNPDGTVRLRADKENVYVSTLLYIPQLASVIVGFNFGAFQIWNLISLSLEYTSRVHSDCVPVTHLGFQEPCDDPRAFCYLWVVYSGIDRMDPKGFPLAVMYSLTYQGKRIISDTLCLYEAPPKDFIRGQSHQESFSLTSLKQCNNCKSQLCSNVVSNISYEDAMILMKRPQIPNPLCYSEPTKEIKQLEKEGEEEENIQHEIEFGDFASCSVRFNLELTSNDSITTYTGGQAIAAHTFSINSNNTSNTGDESILNICHLVWECWTNLPNGPVQYLMLIFDLDQWYKDHMPAMSSIETNTYMSIVNMGDAVGNVESPLCDVRVDCSTLSQYSSVERLEEHFYPNSLAYDCLCLTATDLVHISTKGLQRQLITNLHKIGPIVLLNPTKLYFQCVNAGLTPLYSDVASSKADIAAQREYILSIALESKLLPFLTKCVSDWATGSHSSTGCTHQFFVDWCWNRAITLKKNGRELTTLLFNHSGVMPDRNTCKCLDLCVRQLSNIAVLLENATTKCANTITPDALYNISERHKCIQMVATYFQVIQWFLNVGLLPEFTIDQDVHMIEDENQHLPYPVESLVRFYQKRRYKLHCLNGENPSDQDLQNKSCPLLFVDQLIENECHGEQIHNLWKTGGSTCGGVYPPPSLHALLKIYLLPNIKEEYKHSLVLYLLVDYSMMFDDIRYEGVIRRLMQFPTMFGLSNTEIKATQAFWHLDHRDFDFALDQLQCLTGNSIPEWQHRVVLSALLAQKKTQAALQYTTVRRPLATIKDNSDSKFKEMAIKLQQSLSEDWQASCNLYLARGLIFQAFEVIRNAVKNVISKEEKELRLNFLFEGCKNLGLMSRLLKVPMSILEEDAFVKFLEGCTDKHSKDILVIFYLQNSRFLEAQRFNEAIKPKKASTWHTMSKLTDSHPEKTISDRQESRDLIVDLFCSTLPKITTRLAKCLETNLDTEAKIIDPKPMSVFVQAKSPKPHTYKSSFIQDTIEKASEIWLNRPKLSQRLKRALNIEETPFVCTPKLSRTSRRTQEDMSKLNITNMSVDSQLSPTPNKRPRLSSVYQTENADTSGEQLSAEEIKNKSLLSQKLAEDMENLLHIPPIERKVLWKTAIDTGSSRSRSVREATPQSILKVRRLLDRSNASPIDAKYLAESDDELETASHYTYQSDTASKCLRFDIPKSKQSTPSPVLKKSGTPSPVLEKTGMPSPAQEKTDAPPSTMEYIENIPKITEVAQKETPENPRKKFASEILVSKERSYKDKVRGRRTSHNSSGSLNNSMRDEIFFTENESIADIPETIISVTDKSDSVNSYGVLEQEDIIEDFAHKKEDAKIKESEYNPNVSEESICKGPTPRRSIRSHIPDVASVERRRSLRSRSRTPEVEIKPDMPESLKKMQALIEKGAKGRKALSRLVLETNTCNQLAETSGDSGAMEPILSIEVTPIKRISGRISLLKDRSESLASSTPKCKVSYNVDKPLSEDVESLVSEDTVDMDVTSEETGAVLEDVSLNITTLSWRNKSVLKDFNSSPSNNNSAVTDKVESIIENKPILSKTVENNAVNSSVGIMDSYLLCNKSVLADYDTSGCETSKVQNPNETDDAKSRSIRKSVVTETVHNVTVNSSIGISDSYIETLITNKSVLEDNDSVLIDKVNEPEISSDQSVNLNAEVSIIVPIEESPNRSFLKDEDESSANVQAETIEHQHIEEVVEEIISIDNIEGKDAKLQSKRTADKIELVSKNTDDITTTPVLEERKRIVEIEREIDEIEGEFEVSDDESEHRNLVIDNDSDEGEDIEVLEDEDYDSTDEDELIIEEGEEEEEETDTSVESATNLEEQNIADVISVVDSSSNEDIASLDDKAANINEEIELTMKSKPVSPDPEMILVQEEDVNEDTNDNPMTGAIDKDPFLKPISETSDEFEIQLNVTKVTEETKEDVSQVDFNYSLITDDNSILQSDQSEMRLSYNEESIDAELKNSEVLIQPDTKSDVIQPDTKSDVIQPDTKSDDVIQPDTKSDVVIQPDTKSDVVIQPDTKSDVVNQPDTNSDVIIQPDTDSDVPIQVNLNSDVVIQPNTNSDVVIQPDTNSKAVLQPNTKSDVFQPGTNSDVVIQPDTNSEDIIQLNTNSDVVIRPDTNSKHPIQTDTNSEIAIQTDTNSEVAIQQDKKEILSKAKDDGTKVASKSDKCTDIESDALTIGVSGPIKKVFDEKMETEETNSEDKEIIKNVVAKEQLETTNKELTTEEEKNVDSTSEQPKRTDTDITNTVTEELVDTSKLTTSTLLEKETADSKPKEEPKSINVTSRTRAKSIDKFLEKESKIVTVQKSDTHISDLTINSNEDTPNPNIKTTEKTVDTTIDQEVSIIAKDSKTIAEAQTEENSQNSVDKIETEESAAHEEKITSTRKRTRSVSSTKSDISTRRRSRRSKSIEETSQVKESEEVPTLELEDIKPARRTRRNTRSAEEADNISIASSGRSKRSVPSKIQTISAEDKSASVPRKSRRSMLSLKKSDLSVIPEISGEESLTSKIEQGNSQIKEDYSTTRRLTRKQRSLLEKSLDTPIPEAAVLKKVRRPSAISSTASHADSEYSFQLDDDKASSSEFASVKSIDPITLLDKDDFVGPPDEEEHLETESIISKSSSIASDFTKQKKIKTTRASSVTKESLLAVEKIRTPDIGRLSRPPSESGYIGDLKKTRRSSMNIEKQSTPDSRVSPGSVDSPGRGIRRISFNKAVEALHTPKKGRRTSSDIRSDTDSRSGTPVGPSPDLDKDPAEAKTELTVTPKRTRRTPSVTSETSETPVARRTRRTASVASQDSEEKNEKQKANKK